MNKLKAGEGQRRCKEGEVGRDRRSSATLQLVGRGGVRIFWMIRPLPLRSAYDGRRGNRSATRVERDTGRLRIFTSPRAITAVAGDISRVCVLRFALDSSGALQAMPDSNSGGRMDRRGQLK